MLAELGPRHLTHEILTTLELMAEDTAIVNSRPLVPVCTDSTMPVIFTPSTLLTQKSPTLKAIPGEFTAADLCKLNKQCRHVQHLAITCSGLNGEKSSYPLRSRVGSGEKKCEILKQETSFYYATRPGNKSTYFIFESVFFDVPGAIYRLLLLNK